MKINDINESVLALSGFVPRALLDNEYWKMFGFKSRPKRGKLFRKFIEKTKLAVEDFLERELLMLSMYDVVLAIKKADTSEENKQLHLVGVLANLYQPLVESGLFNNDLEYLNFVKAGIVDYSKYHLVEAFQKREKNYLPDVGDKTLFIDIILFASQNQDHLDNGYTLDRNILSGYISLYNSQNKLKFQRPNDMSETYVQFVIDMLELAQI